MTLRKTRIILALYMILLVSVNAMASTWQAVIPTRKPIPQIDIRGERSIRGDNNALIVGDGIPFPAT